MLYTHQWWAACSGVICWFCANRIALYGRTRAAAFQGPACDRPWLVQSSEVIRAKTQSRQTGWDSPISHSQGRYLARVIRVLPLVWPVASCQYVVMLGSMCLCKGFHYPLCIIW